MEKLFEKSANKIRLTALKYKRYLYGEINWDSRLIGIKGARGTGKTILLLQKLKSDHNVSSHAIYISMDDIYFTANTLIDFVDTFVKHGGKYLFVDEVHKYSNWSQELKNIYDDFPELFVVFTSSSALEIHKGTFDLSRRAHIYHLNELSLREYLNIKYELSFEVVTLDDILYKHQAISGVINDKIKPIAMFNEYLRLGAYPFILEGESNYYERIETIINLIIENDLQSILNINYSTIVKLKKLLYLMSEIVPFKPNITELSKKVDTTRDLLLKYLNYLERANLIQMLRADTKGISMMAKPEKIYLNNTTLMHAMSAERINKGSLRETFFMNQVLVKHQLSYTKRGDFMIDDNYVIEIGGKNKTQKQIKDRANAFIAADDIEYGFSNKVPLWLFGFLY